MILSLAMAHKTELRIACLEPWFGGSHRSFLETYAARSRHRVELHGLAARHWKWRQEASGWELARRLEGAPVPDVLLASDYVDLPRLFGFLGPAWSRVPAALYFHENQLTYLDGGRVDHTHGFSNVLSAVRADAVLFNSAFHREDFARAARDLLGKLPRPSPRAELARALEGSEVVPPLPDLGSIPPGAGPGEGAPLRVAFPHRLEADKDPVGFLEAMGRARERAGAAIELVVLGSDPGRATPEVRAALERHGELLLHVGRARTRETYAHWLGSCDVVVSTATHEFFGVAVVEAMAAGCTPLLPPRLAYPEVVGGAFAGPAVGGLTGDLVGSVAELAARPGPVRGGPARGRARAAAMGFDAVSGGWVERLDTLLERLVPGP